MRVQITNPITQQVHDFYMDDKLVEQLEHKVKPALKKKDEDYMLIIDGGEREGKSVFAQQLATYVDPTFDLSRMCFDPEEFKNAVLNAENGKAVVFDEAYRGLSSKGALSEVNRILVSLMMEMGQKNLFIIIVLPSFFLLEKYVALWRSKGLFHVFKNRKGQKGFWRFYNKKKKKLLYLTCKKDYSYKVKTSFKGRFYNYYTLDEVAYREKKRISLQKGYKPQRLVERWKYQRDKLVYVLKKETGFNIKDLAKTMKENDIRLKESELRSIIKSYEPK